EVAIIFRENAADFGGGAGFVIGSGLDNDRDSPGPVTFVGDFFEIGGLDAFANTALDRALDIVVRHSLPARCLDRAAPTRISIRIATARFRGDGGFLWMFAEDLAVFRVDRAFEALDLRPLAMSRHIGFPG